MRTLLAAAFLLLLVVPVAAHVAEDHPTLVIDTDVGLDDAVALAMALQLPGIDLAAIVAAEGAAGREQGMANLERLLAFFNRADVPLFAPAQTDAESQAPPFRASAEQFLRRALPEAAPPLGQPFAPRAYLREGKKTVILVLGPLTNLAAALRVQPEIRAGIEEVIVSGAGDPERSWNVGRDPEALAAVLASGLRVEFVDPGNAAQKPAEWSEEPFRLGPGTALGETFLRRLLEPEEMRRHYLEGRASFDDELAFLYYTDSAFFQETEEPGTFVPREARAAAEGIRRLLVRGRQAKPHAVLATGALPDALLQEDVRARRAAIVAKNGEEEWFAQVLASEMHEHLGAHSIIGVKMGVRAAELLNAPSHGLRVVSEAGAEPPASCLNDGLIVSTGATPGRGLFALSPQTPAAARASFEMNGRTITLALRTDYEERIRAEIAALLAEHTLESDAYWLGVRRLGLDIWENWHRLELFDVVDAE
ncbi:MAG: nucleoside hydrolase [Planctomycetes bacterium]|nr:nucleoside hydrolase [Planctomycetota bacterium]